MGKIFRFPDSGNRNFGRPRAFVPAVMPAILARIRGGRERGLVARTWPTDSPSVATRRGPRHYPAERVQSPPDSSKDDSPSLCHFYAPRLQYIRPHCLPFTRSKISPKERSLHLPRSVPRFVKHRSDLDEGVYLVPRNDNK